MPMNKILIFIVAIILIVGGLFGIAYFAQKGSSQQQPATATTTTAGPGYTITTLDDGTFTEPAPSLDNPVRYSDAIPAAARTVIQKHIDEDVAKIKADKTNAGAWLDLGLWYHSAEDYQAAAAVWEFLTKVAPKDTTALNNLGRLYHFDLKDFPKSEQYFLRSMKIAPKSMDPYIELFQLYSLSYKKDTSAAVDIMHTAEAQFPNDSGLPFALGAYYRDRGQFVLARAEFEKGVSIARTQGNLGQVAAINAELAKLP